MVGDERAALVEVGLRSRELRGSRGRIRRELLVLALRLGPLVEAARAMHLHGETHERVVLQLDATFELRERDRVAALADHRVESPGDPRLVVLAPPGALDAQLSHEPTERVVAWRRRGRRVGEHRDQVEELGRVVDLACAERAPVPVGELDVLLPADGRRGREDLVPEIRVEVGEERLRGDRPDLIEELDRGVAPEHLRPVAEVPERPQLGFGDVGGQPRGDEERHVVVGSVGDGVG